MNAEVSPRSIDLEAVVHGLEVSDRIAHAARAAFDRLAIIDDGARARTRSRIVSTVIQAFIAERVDESDLAGTTGYGYDDSARARFESLLVRVFGGEAALARPSLVSGTHAIVATLAACARPGELLLCALGQPYDTLWNALAQDRYSLAASGVTVEIVPREQPRCDIAAIERACRERRPSVVFIQRSRGYSARASLPFEECRELIARVRNVAPQAQIIVDECYCELVEEHGALHAGADAIVGSLIKNVGGGYAPTGAYVIGTRDVIERVASRVYAPGLGAALGPTMGLGRLFLQGLFAAPRVVSESLRALDFFAALFAQFGFDVNPAPTLPRVNIIQSIRLGDRRRIEAFARGLQRALPINARFAPEAGRVPGYRDLVIMSSGSFISGATIELSCDAPLREPFDMFVQGGLVAEHGLWGALAAAKALESEGLLPE